MCGSVSSLTHSQNFPLKILIGTFSSLDYHLIIRISLSTEEKTKTKTTCLDFDWNFLVFRSI